MEVRVRCSGCELTGRFMSAMSVPAVEDILITGLMLWRLREIDGAFSDGDARSITFRLALVTLQCVASAHGARG